MRATITAASLAVLVLTAAPLAAPLAAQERDGTPFKWSGDIQSGRSVYAHDLNGSITVEAGIGKQVEVTAIKHWRRGNPDDVKITVTQVGTNKGDILICALWKGQDRCDEDGYHGDRNRDNWWGRDNDDVSVEIRIKLPTGVNIDASSVNGSVDVDGATADVNARTVNGEVTARSTGRVSASTVNGQLRVRTGAITQRTSFSTVNGSITVEIPAETNADLEMNTVNGSLNSDFPLQVEGRIDPRRLRASLGKGGPTLKLSTVNGSIRLRKA